MLYNQNSGYGQAILNMLINQFGSFGRIFVVFDPDDTADQNYQTIQEIMKVDPEGTVRFYTDLKTAYDATQTNNNDVILLSGHSHHTVATMLDVAKNRVHFVGLGTAGATDMQPEVKLGTVAADAAATIKVSGFGNTFTNIYVTNDGTNANSLSALWDAGEGTVYTNCHFAKNSDLGEAAVADVMARGDTTTWRNCKFGVAWIVKTVARCGLSITGTGASARMKHNIFEDCYFVVSSSSAGYHHIRITSTSSLAFENIFKNCIFHAVLCTSIGAVITTAAIASISGLVEGNLLFVNPACNSTDFCTVSDQLKVVGMDMNGGAATATVGIGITPA